MDRANWSRSPGWTIKVDDGDDVSVFVVNDRNGDVVCTVEPRPFPPEAAANANLLAAAPDLYNALYEAFYDVCCDCIQDEYMRNNMRIPSSEEILAEGCPRGEVDCRFLDWIRAIRKARGAEDEI